MIIPPRFANAIFFLTALCGPAMAQRPEAPFWLPDEATVKTIETHMTMPELTGWPHPAPLESFARYYTGWMANGHRIVAGDFNKDEKPGIYIVHFGNPHMGSTGGGCNHIVIQYDLDDRKFVVNQCYGLG
jgi:hypothetical protein